MEKDTFKEAVRGIILGISNEYQSVRHDLGQFENKVFYFTEKHHNKIKFTLLLSFLLTQLTILTIENTKRPIDQIPPKSLAQLSYEQLSRIIKIP